MFPSRVIVPSSLGRAHDSPPITEETILKALQPYSERHMAPPSTPRVEPDALPRPNTTRSRPTFLNIPRELRDNIYGCLLLAEHNQIPQSDHLDFDTYDPINSLGTLTPAAYNFHTAILSTNRQIHAEALEVLKANHFILVRSNYPLLAKYGASIRTPLASRSNLLDTATKFKHHLMTMDVQVDFPDHDIADYLARMRLKRADCHFLLLAADLPAFRKSMTDHHLHLPLFLDSMTLTCKIRTGKIVPALERALLEPLGRFRGFGKVVIAGNVSPAYARSLERQMVRREVAFGDLVDAAYEKKEEGNRAARRGDWELAVSLWVRAMDSVHDGMRFHPEVVAGATAEQCRAVEKLFVSAKLNIILGRLKRRDWKSAIENVQLLFRYYGAKMDGETTAKAYYRKGLAYAGGWRFGEGGGGVEEGRRARERKRVEDEEREMEQDRERMRVEEEERERERVEEEGKMLEERERLERTGGAKKRGKKVRRGKKAKDRKKEGQETEE
ncbi:MAG: hypothetical protein FRX48_08735 [Lasallia pustulata]|uniref:Tetratricopeptide-like helical domain n=1 Tax=Lasallia pustulata TaxID=136370 RepID=A0A5M8PFH8_9LECA|nr:MAG: hypothetical protein FRX48_08735 [Lasallia pustulata]